MASSGKKGKRNKGTVISLQSFLANGEPQVGVTQVAKKVRNYDSDEDDGSLPQVFQLPTAPRASRIYDDDSIPHKPPFQAFVTNLPFDVNEEDIFEFFYPIELASLRLPREDGETGRVRGFGYVEFDTRDDLIGAISIPDPQIKNRRIRIEVSNENEQQYQRRNNDRNNRRGYDGFGSGDRESTNWRRDKDNDNDNDRDRGGRREGGRNYERNYDRGGSSGFNRDRPPRDGSQERGGSWRTGDRPAYSSSPRRAGGSSYNNNRYSARSDYNNDAESGGSSRRDDDVPQERPKLNLKPRTLPLPEVVKRPESEEPPSSDADQKTSNQDSASDSDTKSKSSRPGGISAEKVFGSAKPVDTAAREREIEERLEEARRQDRLRRENEQKEPETDISVKLSEVQLNKDDKETKNTAISSWRRRDDDTEDTKISPDPSRGPRRNDDDRRGQDNRDYNRDNRNRDRIDRNDRNDRSDRYDRNDRFNRDRQNNRENRPRDDSKQKREPRAERPMPKYQPPTPGPVLQTANKYSGLLDDEGSD